MKLHSKFSTSLLFIPAKTFDFSRLKSLVENVKDALDAHNDHLATWAKSSTSMAWNVGHRLTKIEHTQALMQADLSSLKSDTFEIKSMMTEIFQAFKETKDKVKKEQKHERPTRAIPISIVKPLMRPNPELEMISSPLTIKLTDTTLEIQIPQPTDPVIDITSPEPQVTQRKGKGIATEEQLKPSLKKLVPASKEVRPDPDAPILVPYEINGKIFQLTEEQIQAHMDKDEQIKKVAEEAQMFEMTKTEVIKVVQEEAEKIRLDPKTIINAKAGEKFKKAQDVEHQVLKREHSQKVKRLIELNKKRAEQYIWTIYNRLKPEPITDVKIHPNSKPALLTVFKNNDKRNFQVYSPFKFFDFGVTELDEL
ncbi:hypothetical protein Tco_0637327, partial [Tanacetum coccineum]